MGTAILIVLGLALLAALIAQSVSASATDITLATGGFEAKDDHHGHH